MRTYADFYLHNSAYVPILYPKLIHIAFRIGLLQTTDPNPISKIAMPRIILLLPPK